jgi:hypothetical protein
MQIYILHISEVGKYGSTTDPPLHTAKIFIIQWSFKSTVAGDCLLDLYFQIKYSSMEMNIKRKQGKPCRSTGYHTLHQ